MPRSGKDNKLPNEIKIARYALLGTLISALFGLAGIVVTSSFRLREIEVPINATKTAEAKSVMSATPSPFVIITDLYSQSGLMGDLQSIQIDNNFRANCYSIPCIKITWRPGQEGWVGLYWQYPPGNWGDKPGCNLSGATSVTFWARGEVGGERIRFEAAYPQTGTPSPVKTQIKELIQNWQAYTIDLSGQDLTNVTGAFAWFVEAQENPTGLTFYLDDIRYMGLSEAEAKCP